MKILKISKDFKPCEIHDDDEYFPNGIFVFNVTKMIKYIEENKAIIPLNDTNVVDYHYKDFSSEEEDYINSADLNRPVILIEINPGTYNMIDGYHRVEKAYRAGIKTLKAYRLTVDQHLQFLTTKKGYEAFVEYWNGKVRDLLNRNATTVIEIQD